MLLSLQFHIEVVIYVHKTSFIYVLYSWRHVAARNAGYHQVIYIYKDVQELNINPLKPSSYYICQQV
jgi:hypothetical protein